ncbi:MAG TPA: DUF885 domain-containing protein [Saprospiraceae bacterium]|nr:DUF885 domain-containing protein [Saprospiraceae bacterium]
MTSFRFLSTLYLCLTGMLVAAQYPLDSLNTLYEKAWRFGEIPRPLDGNAPEDDPRLADMSMEAIAYRRAYWEGVKSKLSQVSVDALQDQDRINFEVFRYIVDDNVAGFEYHTYLMPFNAEGGFHTDFGFIPGSSSFDTKKQYEDYLVKLSGFPALVDQYISLLRQGMKDHYTMPSVVMQDFERTAEAYVTPDPEVSVFFSPFKNIPESVADATLLKERGRHVVADEVIPAYLKLGDFLKQEYIPACRRTIGATALPNGKEHYEQRVQHFTTLDMSAEEIFAIGQQEVARIHAEMQTIIDSLGFDGSFADFLYFLRTDARFYAQTPHELLAEASYFSKKIDGKLPEYFGKLPRLPYGVEPVPAEIAPRYTGGRYSPGSYKDHRAGAYWVNTYMLESRPLYVLPSLTLHEAVPGHHFQISLAAEAAIEGNHKLPDFRNEYYISAFGEGWALYTEWLGKEMGIYEDPYQQFGSLTYEMWRACRLVVDPGMHAMGWTREQAVGFMAENTALSLHEINTEIDRYIGWPGQAVSYKIGELKIRALRKEAEVALGDKFDLRTFHDVVLQNGSVPLFVLERVVREWIRKNE